MNQTNCRSPVKKMMALRLREISYELHAHDRVCLGLPRKHLELTLTATRVPSLFRTGTRIKSSAPFVVRKCIRLTSENEPRMMSLRERGHAGENAPRLFVNCLCMCMCVYMYMYMYVCVNSSSRTTTYKVDKTEREAGGEDIPLQWRSVGSAAERSAARPPRGGKDV